MASLLIFVTLLHLTVLAVLFIATVEKFWWVWDDTESSDLWYNCIIDNETEAWVCATSYKTEWLQAVQVLIVLSMVFSSISFLIFLGQLFILSKGGPFYLSGLCQVFAGLHNFTAILIYTLHYKEILQDSRESSSGHFGFCFVLAWVCVPFLLCSGITYIHLRKKGNRHLFSNSPNESCKECMLLKHSIMNGKKKNRRKKYYKYTGGAIHIRERYEWRGPTQQTLGVHDKLMTTVPVLTVPSRCPA